MISVGNPFVRSPERNKYTKKQGPVQGYCISSAPYVSFPMRKLDHQEIAAQRLSPGAIEHAERMPIIGMLDNIRSLYNVGSLFRTSDGAFVKELFLCGYTPAPPRKEIDKTALGATSTIPWRHFPDPLDAVKEARTLGYRVCVLEHTTRSV